MAATVHTAATESNVSVIVYIVVGIVGGVLVVSIIHWIYSLFKKITIIILLVKRSGSSVNSQPTTFSFTAANQTSTPYDIPPERKMGDNIQMGNNPTSGGSPAERSFEMNNIVERKGANDLDEWTILL